jgi:hypothetical protein
VLPFVVLYWMVPFISKHTIGNDYLQYWIRMQLFLRFSVENGTFPLYAPGFNGGWTASALTLGQLWHPISWLAASLPGYWSGHAHELGTLLRLLSLGGTHLVLFLFLRRLRLNPVMGFVISFITVYNLRMLDMFRYGAALENYVAHLLLCAAVAWHYLTPTKRAGPLCIAVCTWLLVVGGHPQIMYLGLLGAGLVCLVAPFYMARLLPDEVQVTRQRLWRYYLSVGLAVGAGVIVGASYVLPFYFEYLPETSRGLGVSFSWACGHQDTLVGGLCNFFNPFYSDVNGSFGGSVLILMCALTPMLLLRIRVPWPMLCLWLICAVIFILTLGSNGPLYYYFWKYFPFARSFRVPGRLSVLLPFMFLLLLTWMTRLEAIKVGIRNWQLRCRPIALVAAAALTLFIVLRSLGLERFALEVRWQPAKMHKIPSTATILFFATGIASLLSLAFYNSLRRLRPLTGGFLAGAVLLQVAVMLRYGTWVAPSPLRTPTFEVLSRAQQQRLSFWGPSGDWSRLLISEHLERTFLEPTLARVCRKFTVVSSREEAYERMAGERSIDRLLVENYQAGAAKAGPPPAVAVSRDFVRLKYGSFNNFRFDVKCAAPAFFVFSYPYCERWTAYINGQKVPVYRANAIEQAVRLLAGQSEVEFRYWSWLAIAGSGLSGLGLVSIALVLFSGLHARLLRGLAIVATPCACTLAFFVWYHSLYEGGNLGTNYAWTSELIRPHLSSDHNLAYGKRTSMSTGGAVPYSEHNSLGVDGQRDPRHGFITDLQERAWWQVDLGQAKPLAEIFLYKRAARYKRCTLPFDVMVSKDEKRWFLVDTVTQEGGRPHWRIRLEGISARYIRIQTQEPGCLALAEVEVYGPADAELPNGIK